MNRRWSRAAIALLLAFSALRFVKWGSSLTLDEGYMLQHFASQPVSFISTHYEAPNNHILLSIILHGLEQVSPKRLIVTLNDVRLFQLVSILAAIAALALTFLLAQCLFNETIALFALTALGVSAWHLLYSHLLRAYSLSAFFCLLNVWLVWLALERRRYWLALSLPLTLTAFHYLLPTNVVYTGAIGAWALYLINARRLREERRAAQSAQAQRAGLSQRGLNEKKAAQKLEKLGGELARKRLAARRLALTSAAAAAACLAASLAMTYWLYIPIIPQMKAWSKTPWTWGVRFFEMSQVLGATTAPRWWFMAVAAAGLGMIWRRRRRFGGVAVLALGMAVLPLVASMIQSNFLPSRVYLAALPVWAMVFACGAYWPVVWLRRRLPRQWTRAVVCAVIIVAAAPELAYFIQWHRGMDLRAVLERLEPWARQDDDFSVLFAYQEPDIRFGYLADQYYGFASNMLPYEQSNRYEDSAASYLERRRYVFVARKEAEARQSLKDSGVDRFAAKTFHLQSTLGTFGLYEVDVDDGVLRDYWAAAGDARQGAPARAEALMGLAVQALRQFQPRQAEEKLALAAQLSPQDVRARYLLGYARYLSGDARAAQDFEWTIAHDTMNAHVRFYYGDLLADQGRNQEASQQYLWYFSAQQLPSAWVLQDRVRAALDALRAGHGRAATAADYARKGAYEKAILAFEKAASARPLTSEELGQEARLEMASHHYARAALLAQKALAAGAGPEVKLQLANALAMRKDFDGARRIVDGLLASYPQNASLVSYREFLAGM